MALESYTKELNDLQEHEDKGDDKFHPVQGSRLTKVHTAVNIYKQLKRDDAPAARNRARVDQMVDGVPPHNPALLRSKGQGSRCNLNFGDGQRHMDAAQAGYVDLLTSVEFLVDVKTTAGDDFDVSQTEANAILNEELSETIRNWPDFDSRFLSLSSEFLRHGVGAAYYTNKIDWRFNVTGLADFKLPRNTPASDDAIDVCFAIREYTPDELFGFIDRPEVANDQGWDVEQVKRAIMRAHSGNKTDRTAEFEKIQQDYKSGTDNGSLRNKTVKLVHVWVKELDGTISHFIFDECLVLFDDKRMVGQGFLYRAVKEFETAEQVYTTFKYGVGNGKFHSIRGFGQRIFPFVQEINRAMCSMVDQAQVLGALTLQPSSPEALRRLAFQHMGGYNVIDGDFEVLDKKLNTNLTTTSIPVINMMRGRLDEAADFFSTSEAAKGSPYRNILQVRSEIESATRLSAANLALFYMSLDRVFREVVRRIVTGPKHDNAIAEFFERCQKRGLDVEQIKSIDHRATKAARAIGAGNPAARVAVLDELDRERGFFDEVGNRNLTFDRTAARVGHEAARRYVLPAQQPRGSIDETFAVVENAMLQNGMAVPVLPAQLHGTHLQLHLPLALDLIEGVVGGVIDPVAELETMTAISDHVAQHAEALAADPTQQAIVAQSLDAVGKLGQIIDNTDRSLQAEGGEDGDAETDAKINAMNKVAEAKRQNMMAEAALKRRIEEEKAAQARRLNDLKAATDIQRNAARQEQAHLMGLE